MNLLYRILLTIYAFCLTILSVIVAIISIRHELLYNVYRYLNDQIFDNTGSTIAVFIISLVFIGLSFTFLISGVKSGKQKRSVGKTTNIGEIRISLNTIENIALAASRKLNGVKDSKAYVTKLEGGVYINIKAIVMLELNIPSLSEEIQNKVKHAIEECAGVKVVGVKVMVENVYTGYKSRVE